MNSEEICPDCSLKIIKLCESANLEFLNTCIRKLAQQLLPQPRGYAEYEGTIHQNNSSGVRATCPDCHVPKEWGPKVIRKIQASRELYGHFFTGVIDTPEKFDAHRLELSSRVWTAMKKTHSRECRNCHKFDYMDFTMQENRAAQNHQQALDQGKTCIACHPGIAHGLPEGCLDAYKKVADQH